MTTERVWVVTVSFYGRREQVAGVLRGDRDAVMRWLADERLAYFNGCPDRWWTPAETTAQLSAERVRQLNWQSYESAAQWSAQPHDVRTLS
jgi:hypothetical protein